MRFTTPSFRHEGPIPEKYAFGVPDPRSHIALGQNLNPALEWSDLPPGTRSVALVCHDADVPTEPTNVNREGVTVSRDLKRTDFYHWVIVDLPSSLGAIQEGELSRGVTPRGKREARTLHGARQGVNSYTDWFASDADMKGDYVGYDGPCPPWNDELVHHYHFTLYALSVGELDLPERFDGPQALAALTPHVLERRTLIGTYTLNPKLR